MKNNLSTTPPKEPIFNIKEKSPIVLGGVFIAIYALVFYGGSFGLGFVERLAEIWGVLKSADYPGQSIATKASSLVLHGFLHGSWTHVLMNAGLLVPFGVVTIRGAHVKTAAKMGDNVVAIGRRSNGTSVFFFIFFAGVIVGGLGQLLQWNIASETGSALGASGGVSALFASMAWATGGPRQLLKFGFGWLVINILMIFFGGLMTGGGGIAWAAHLAGFAAGAALAPLTVQPNIGKSAIISD